MKRIKEPIKVRSRLLKNGSRSLYLDIYINGQRSYEYLKLYLIPERTKKDKETNTQTMQLAEAIKGKRMIELQNGRFGFDGQYKLDVVFLDYYRSLCEKRFKNKESLGNWGNWYSCLKHLEDYTKRGTKFRDITPAWCQGFRDHLDKATTRNKKKEKTIHTAKDDAMLSQNTKVSYWRKLKACLNQAVRDHIIPSNPCDGIEGFKEDESERVYLTKEEVGLMWNTECQYSVLKCAFLFSCLTGLRKSDIERLHWGEVHKQGEFTRIIFRQKKTGGVEYIDLNEQAVSLMGERGEDNERVFAGFHYSAYLNVELNRWALRAGITKHISYHTSRHTFALMMLDLGVDIYTVSRLLGHKEINTTMVYAHILDSKKQEAMSRIPKFDID